jgi:hypothetical protein
VQACVYLFFYTLFFVCRLLYKNVKIKIYENIIFLVVFAGCKAWPVTLKGERRLRILRGRGAEEIIWM